MMASLTDCSRRNTDQWQARFFLLLLKSLPFKLLNFLTVACRQFHQGHLESIMRELASPGYEAASQSFSYPITFEPMKMEDCV